MPSAARRSLFALALLFCGSFLIAGEAAPPATTPPTVPPVLATELPVLPPMPPSPSAVSGERIWPDPAFTHWPAIVFADESRNLSFALPVRKAGVAGSVGWEGAEALPFVLPSETDRISGLLPVPSTIGHHVATARIDKTEWRLPLRLADVHQPWPLKGLRAGFPVDENGVPTILVDQRRDPSGERKWMLLDRGLARPKGKALVVGDPLEALGRDTWVGLDADLRPVTDDRYPQHAALVALSDLPAILPRTIVWSPGNQVLFGGAWSQEEERVLAALRSRCEELGAMPQMVLVLPPVPLNHELQEIARTRRELLTRSAAFLSWTIIDLEPIAGPATTANRVADGVYTRYPNGEAQERIRQALKQALEL